ncbi:hypothetical protein QBC46DRAFT_244268, partial [Diplogelasinospora grovesii]
MAVQYSPEFLLFLRESPLCTKPSGLPPAEEWMGPPPETFRNQTKTTNDRVKGGESLLLNQENRRPALDRNGSRNPTNPDDIILGPPRTNFASATSMRSRGSTDADKAPKDSERQDRGGDRFNFRSRGNDTENTNDRFRDRDGRNNNSTFRRRGDQDQDKDSEGWSTVKPRKSFGTEGAERFHGRMGGGGDRYGNRDDRRTRDRDDRDNGDRRNRNLDHHKDGEEIDSPRRNGLSRGKSEPWFKDNNNENNSSNNNRNSGGANNDSTLSQRERIDRAKSWRERDDDRYGDRHERNQERRWDREREQRAERDPEWLDEPAEEKTQGHTEEDFKKFMETMKARSGGAGGGGGMAALKPEEKPSVPIEKPATDSFFGMPEQKVLSAPAMETGPDKFFAAYGIGGLDVSTPAAENKEAAKPKGNKSSRFMAFLAPQEDGSSRVKTEPPTPAAMAQPPPHHGSAAEAASAQPEGEKEAFALLIQKLQRSQLGPAPPLNSGNPPPSQLQLKFPEPSPIGLPDFQQKSAVSPEPFQQYGGDRREDARHRTPQHPLLSDILSPRPLAPPVQPPQVTRPDQALLQDLLAQRHQVPAPGHSQTSARMAQNAAAASQNSQAEFLMRLMQSHREAPEPSRPEQLLMRMPQPQKQVSIANISDRDQGFQRDQDYQRERSSSQRQMRGQGPPGFLEDQFHPPDVVLDSRPQPTQILQRPPPPGLDHHMHQFQMVGGGGGRDGGAPGLGGISILGGGGAGGNGGGSQQMPPQRPMIPPPGLVNGPGPRNLPLPGMFAPNFAPPHSYGPPPNENMVGPPQPPRSMQPPPGFLGAFGGPPPGFMPGPPGM